MNKTFYITVFLFTLIIPVSFWVGVKSQEPIAIRLQADIIQAQKAHKESLRNEAEYLERLNTCFDKTTEYFKEIPITIMSPPNPKEIIVTVGGGNER